MLDAILRGCTRREHYCAVGSWFVVQVGVYCLVLL